MKTLSTEQALRYSRQILLPSFDLDGQERLLNARVLQIGVGGLGCACAQTLVSSGIGQLTLVDDDNVDATNMPRQPLFTAADVGKSKVNVAQQRLAALNTDCALQTIAERLDDKALAAQLAEHDLVIDCSDNLATRNQINRLAWRAGKANVLGAAIRMEGQLTTLIPGAHNPCYACISRLFGEQELSCVEAGVLAPIVGIIGQLQALEAIKVLSGVGEPLVGRLQLFDGQDLSWQTIKVPKNPECAICANL